MLEEELVWKVQTESYGRELERYGASTMELSETLFFKQSQLIVQLLQQELSEERYFIKVLRIVDNLISYFSFDEDTKIRFLENNSISFSNEFELDKQAKLDAKNKYQKLKQSITDEFADQGLVDSSIFFNEVKEIIILNKKGLLEISIENYVASQVHMLVNRAFRDKQRLYEMLVYEFLTKINQD